MELLQRTFDLPKRCNISSITIRETTGIDEQNAALAAEVLGATGNILEELIGAAIMQIDGNDVTPPGNVPFKQWNTRTRKVIMKFFDVLNDVSDEELGPLIAAATAPNGRDPSPVPAPTDPSQATAE